MTRYRQTLVEVFDAYKDDASAALQAFANIDPEGWSEFVDDAAEVKYLAAYRSHRRSLVESVRKDVLAEATGQARLFEMPAEEQRVELRRTVVLDGEEFDLASLTGHEGAAIARKVAERDLQPALTSVNRCKMTLRLADHVDAETERLGRPVTFGEVLGWAA